MRTRQCAEPTCPFMVTDESAMWGWVHLDTHGVDTSDHEAKPWLEECPTCNGSGMVAVGPWGSRPPRKRCPDCRGGVTFKPKPEDLMLALHARLVQISVERNGMGSIELCGLEACDVGGGCQAREACPESAVSGREDER